MAKWVMNIQTLLTEHGGPTNAVLSIAAELVEDGHEVHVVYRRLRGKDEDIRARAKPGLHFHPVLMKKPKRFGVSLRHLTTVLKVSRRAHGISAHGFYQFTCIAAFAAALLNPSAHFVIQPHGVFEPYQERQRRRSKLIFIHLVGRLILARTDSVFVASNSERDGILGGHAALAPKIVVTGLGVHAPARTDPSHTSSLDDALPSVLYLSRIAPKKRLDLLIEACRLLAYTDTPIRLDVAGTGSPVLLEALIQQADGLPVAFHGHVVGERKAALIMSAELFCLPSENENFGQAVVEAMAGGLPVVTTADVGAARHVRNSNGGWILNKPTAADLAKTIATAISDFDLRKEMGASAAAYCRETLSWATVAQFWTAVTQVRDHHRR